MQFLQRADRTVTRLGILPGTFNPVTVAHLAVAQAGLRAVDEVVFLLPRAFPHKPYTGASFEDRIGMLQSVLPRDLLYSAKRGFGAPVREWFRGPEGEGLIQQLMNSPLRARNFFDYDYIERLADEHRKEVTDWSFHLWCLLNLSLWYERWIG